MKFIVVRMVVSSIFLVSAFIWGHRKDWRKYYHTMCFFGMGDLIYIAVFQDNPLWLFPPAFLVPAIDEVLLIFAVFFPTTLLFLSNYPQKLWKQIMYNALWIGVYMVIEVVDLKIGVIKYYNGWNIWWSLLHNTIQFPLIVLHNKKPLFAWGIALVFLVVVMKIFDVPILMKP